MFRCVNNSAGPRSCSLANTCGCKAMAGISAADGVSAHTLAWRFSSIADCPRCDGDLRLGLGLLAQFLALIFDLKAQLPQVFNIDLMLAGAPVLRVGDTNLQFAQAGAIGLHVELQETFQSVDAVPGSA